MEMRIAERLKQIIETRDVEKFYTMLQYINKKSFSVKELTEIKKVMGFVVNIRGSVVKHCSLSLPGDSPAATLASGYTLVTDSSYSTATSISEVATATLNQAIAREVMSLTIRLNNLYTEIVMIPTEELSNALDKQQRTTDYWTDNIFNKPGNMISAYGASLLTSCQLMSRNYLKTYSRWTVPTGLVSLREYIKDYQIENVTTYLPLKTPGTFTIQVEPQSYSSHNIVSHWVWNNIKKITSEHVSNLDTDNLITVGPGDNILRVMKVVLEDHSYDKYSKSWHKAHGPAKTRMSAVLVLLINDQVQKFAVVNRAGKDQALGYVQKWLKIAPRVVKGSKLEKKLQGKSMFRIKKLMDTPVGPVYVRTLANRIYDFGLIRKADSHIVRYNSLSELKY